MTEAARLLGSLPIERLLSLCANADRSDVVGALRKEHRGPADLAFLISPAADEMLEELARASACLTARRFGKAVLLYAPLYLSNECVNGCVYCGFRSDLDVKRTTLTPPQIEKELRFLTEEGFRHILLVTGEHPRVDCAYLEEAVRIARSAIPSVSLEVEPLDADGYRRMVAAGADSLTLYQETYDRNLYAEYHPRGPKRNYDKRLEAPSMAAEAGIRRLNIGALLGLADWRSEVFYLVAHAKYLAKKYWQTHISISFPRIRNAGGGFLPPHPVEDRELARMICAVRLLLPDAGLVLSTRERPGLRDGLVCFGITQMSAGSRTEPGGYLEPDEAERQFAVDDVRSPSEVAGRLAELGFDPVWKDWEEALHG